MESTKEKTKTKTIIERDSPKKDSWVRITKLTRKPGQLVWNQKFISLSPKAQLAMLHVINGITMEEVEE